MADETLPASSRYLDAIREQVRQMRLADRAFVEMTTEERAAAPWVCLAGHEVSTRSRGCPRCQKDLWLMVSQPLHDVRCGLHSGIPACCIAFFFVWKRWLANTAWAETQPKDWGYAPCPRCVRMGRRITVQKCDCFQKRHGTTTAG